MARVKYFDTAMLPIFFGFTTDERAYNSEMKRMGVQNPTAWMPENADGCCHTFESKHGTTCIVCIDTSARRTRTEMASLVTHECVHVWQQVREVMHEIDPSHEFEAYTIQYLTQCVLSEIWRTRK